MDNYYDDENIDLDKEEQEMKKGKSILKKVEQFVKDYWHIILTSLLMLCIIVKTVYRIKNDNEAIDMEEEQNSLKQRIYDELYNNLVSDGGVSHYKDSCDGREFYVVDAITRERYAKAQTFLENAAQAFIEKKVSE